MLATTIHKSNTTPHHQDGATTNPSHPNGRESEHPRFPQQQGKEVNGPVVSKPNSVSDEISSPAHTPEEAFPRTGMFVVHQNRNPLQAQPIQRIAQLTEPPHDVGGA